MRAARSTESEVGTAHWSLRDSNATREDPRSGAETPAHRAGEPSSRPSRGNALCKACLLGREDCPLRWLGGSSAAWEFAP